MYSCSIQTSTFQIIISKTLFSVADKEVEADSIRKNTSEQVVMIQGKLEDEIRKRADVIKQKKKTESQIQDLEAQIVSQNKYLADLNKEWI